MTGQSPGTTERRAGDDTGRLSWRAAAWNVLSSAGAYRRYVITFLAGALVGVLILHIGTNGLPIRNAYDPHNGALIMLSGEDPTDARKKRVEAWNRWVHGWNKEHENDEDSQKPTVNVVWLPGSPEQQHAEMLRRVQSPSTSSSMMADVLVLDTPWTRQFASADHIRPIGWEVDESGFLPKPLQTCKVDGTLYALPFNTDVGLLFSMESTKEPATREEMFAEAPTSVPPVFAGQFGPGETFVVNVIEAVAALGGEEIVGEDGRLDLRHDDVKKALGSLAEELTDPDRTLPESVTSDEASLEEIFQAKPTRVRYMRDWTTYTRRLAKALGDDGESSEETRQAARERVQKATWKLPWNSVLGGQNLAITQKSRSPQAAAEFIQWMTGEASQTRLFEEGGFAPTRATVYADPTITDAYPHAADLRSAIDNAIVRPDVPNYPLLSRVFQDVVRDALTNRRELKNGELTSIDDAQEGELPP